MAFEQNESSKTTDDQKASQIAKPSYLELNIICDHTETQQGGEMMVNNMYSNLHPRRASSNPGEPPTNVNKGRTLPHWPEEPHNPED